MSEEPVDDVDGETRLERAAKRPCLLLDQPDAGGDYLQRQLMKTYLRDGSLLLPEAFKQLLGRGSRQKNLQLMESARIYNYKARLGKTDKENAREPVIEWSLGQDTERIDYSWLGKNQKAIGVKYYNVFYRTTALDRGRCVILLTDKPVTAYTVLGFKTENLDLDENEVADAMEEIMKQPFPCVVNSRVTVHASQETTMKGSVPDKGQANARHLLDLHSFNKNGVLAYAVIDSGVNGQNIQSPDTGVRFTESVGNNISGQWIRLNLVDEEGTLSLGAKVYLTCVYSNMYDQPGNTTRPMNSAEAGGAWMFCTTNGELFLEYDVVGVELEEALWHSMNDISGFVTSNYQVLKGSTRAAY